MAKRRTYRSEGREAELEAAAKAYKDMSENLGLGFRYAQQEAYEDYCAWEEELATQTESVVDLGIALIGPQLVLLILALLREKRMYAYQVCQRIKELGQGRYELKFETLYPLLYGLVQDGILGEQRRTGPQRIQRTYYFLTDKGIKILEREQKSLSDIFALFPEWLGGKAH